MNITRAEVFNNINDVNRKYFVLLGIFLPLINMRVNIGSYFDASFFMIFVLIIGGLKLLNRAVSKSNSRIKIYKIDFLIFALLLYMVFSLFISMNISSAIAKIIKFMVLLVLFYFSREIYMNDKSISRIMDYSIISCAGYIIYLSYFYLIKFQRLYIGVDVINGSRAGRNSFALVLLIIFSFSFGKLLEIKNKKELYKLLPSFGVLAVGVLLLQSRGIIVALTIAILFVLIKMKSIKKIKRPLFIGLLLITVIIFLVPSDIRVQILNRIQSIFALFDDTLETVDGIGSINYRRALISISIEAINQNPLIGIGIGSFKVFNVYGYASPHNDYLYFMSEFGIIGLLLYIGILLTFFIMADKNYRINKTSVNLGLLTSMIGIIIYSSFINAYDNFLIWTVYAMIYSTYIKQRKKRKEKGRSG